MATKSSAKVISQQKVSGKSSDNVKKSVGKSSDGQSQINEEIRASIYTFLKSNNYDTTASTFLKELKVDKSALEAVAPRELLAVWNGKAPAAKADSSDSASSDSSSSSDSDSDADSKPKGKEKEKEKAKPKPSVRFGGTKDESSSSSSSSSSDEESTTPTAAKNAKPAGKKVFVKTPLPAAKPPSDSSDSSSSSSSSSSDSDSDSAPKTKAKANTSASSKPSLPVKRKLADSDSDSSSGSGSDSDSDSDAAPASKKVKAKLSSSSDSSSSSSSGSDSETDSEDEREQTKARLLARQAEMKRKTEESAAAAQLWLSKANEAGVPKKGGAGAAKGSPRTGSGQAFKRVDADVWGKEIKSGLEDNSYEKAFGEDGYGAKASEKLMTVQGKKFQHEKTKKKRGSYRGGVIDASENTKSFKYADSD